MKSTLALAMAGVAASQTTYGGVVASPVVVSTGIYGGAVPMYGAVTPTETTISTIYGQANAQVLENEAAVQQPAQHIFGVGPVGAGVNRRDGRIWQGVAGWYGEDTDLIRRPGGTLGWYGGGWDRWPLDGYGGYGAGLDGWVSNNFNGYGSFNGYGGVGGWGGAYGGLGFGGLGGVYGGLGFGGWGGAYGGYGSFGGWGGDFQGTRFTYNGPNVIAGNSYTYNGLSNSAWANGGMATPYGGFFA